MNKKTKFNQNVSEFPRFYKQDNSNPNQSEEKIQIKNFEFEFLHKKNHNGNNKMMS